MLECGIILKVTIEKIVLGGEGLGFYEGMAIFVPQSLPGEIVEVEIISSKKDYARGIIKKIISPSTARAKERYCEHQDLCGGCDFIFVESASQGKIKEEILKQEVIRRHLSCEVTPFVEASQMFEYRNKVILPIQSVNKRVKIGFYQPRSHKLVPIHSCRIQPAPFNLIIQQLEKWFNEEQVLVYDEKTQRGVFRNVMLRQNRQGEIMVAFIVTKITNEVKKIASYVKTISTIASCYAVVNSRKDNVLLTNQCELLFGKKVLYETLMGLYFQISPLSFFQINLFQTEKLYEKALSYLPDISTETVLDAYSGTGTLAMLMAKVARKVIGIEVIEAAVKDAEFMSKRNGLTNVSFYQGTVEKILPLLVKEGVHFDTVMVDPPRKGLERSVIDTIAKEKIKSVVYISCSPATLMRDIQYFQEQGYVCHQLTGVEMFPNTSHVETVVLIERKKP